MKRILLLHHLGLGDHFMCHGIVREYCGRYDHVTIFSYPHNQPTVAFMFRDLPNLDIITVKDVEEAKATVAAHGPEYEEVKVLGFENLDRTSGVELEKQFYDGAGLPLSKKWEAFHIERDLAREEALYDKVAPKGPYAFVHEDASRKYLIKQRYISKGLTVFLPDPSEAASATDFLTIIDKAQEVHVIDSSFMFLIDCLPRGNPSQKLFVHRYARENNDWQLPILRKDWTIITAQPNILDPLRRFFEQLYRLDVFPFTTTFFKRSVRWFFRQMLWTMGQPDVLNVGPIIKRYVPTRSFVEIGSSQFVELAKVSGASSATSTVLESASADVVLYYGDPTPILQKLRQATKTIFILVGRFPADMETRLANAGFGVRERNLFSGDSCLICRAI